MRNQRTRTWMWALLMIAFSTCLYAGAAPPPAEKTEEPAFRAEPQARALYDEMMRALRQPQTLSYQSEYREERRGEEIARCPYRVWLKKPNYFRVEVGPVAYPDGPHGGTIVGDGENMWLFWLGDRPYFGDEDRRIWEKTRSNSYMTQATPLARHSISHMTGPFGAGLTMPILDASTFHGYTDVMQGYIDGIMGLGVEKVGEEWCDVVEVSIMKHQRSWYLWLSQKDHLPRKLKQIVRLAKGEAVMHEIWSDVVIDGDLPAETFVWTPPAGWQRWERPNPQDLLLKPGTPAPDFELTALSGGRIKLSDFRNKIVWFYIWRAG
jgi:outer membrane lipoprotein-sorting protein